jgi:hypothetical protein
MLPNTVYLRQVPDTAQAEKLRDLVDSVFIRLGLRPVRVFGGILEDWATLGPPAHP